MEHGLKLSRRLLQGGILLAVVLIPLLGILRIDLAHGRFILFGYQIWWSDFFITYPFWIMVITFMAALYTILGMVFCGWGCPQNTLSEFADKVIKKLVGRRATVGIGELENGAAAESSGSIRDWGLVVLVFLGVSLLFGLVGSIYFLPPGTSWSLTALPGWFWVVTSMIAAVIFLDLILIRHFWCLYVCPYGLYQYLFHHPRTMRVGFDEKRQTDCIGCNRCTDSCFMGVEPRLTKVFTRCINCGDCIVACDDVAAKKGFQPLLNFTFERDDVSHAEIGGSIIGRTAWPLAIFSVAAAFFSYGVYTYQPVRLQVSQVSWSAAAVPGSEGRGSEQMNGREGDYLVEVFNKSPKTQHWALAVSGLPKDAVVFARETVTLPGGTSEKVVLRIRENHPLLHPETPYPFEVMVRDPRTSGPVLSEHTVYYPMSWRG